MPLRSSIAKKFLSAPLIIFLFGVIYPFIISFGQNPSDMPLRQVITEAQTKIGQGDFAGASPLLDELELRFEDEEDPKLKKFFNNSDLFVGLDISKVLHKREIRIF